MEGQLNERSHRWTWLDYSSPWEVVLETSSEGKPSQEPEAQRADQTIYFVLREVVLGKVIMTWCCAERYQVGVGVYTRLH